MTKQLSTRMEMITDIISIFVTVTLVLEVIPKIGIMFFEARRSFAEAGGEEGDFFFKVFEVLLLFLLIIFQVGIRVR